MTTHSHPNYQSDILAQAINCSSLYFFRQELINLSDLLRMLLSKVGNDDEFEGSLFTQGPLPSLPSKVVLKHHCLGWAWEVTDVDFEVIHGLSRIVKLLPHQLATALLVQHDIGDGAYFCNLIKDLMAQFQSIHRRKQDNRPHPRIEDLKTLSEVMDQCFWQLHTLSRMMQRNEGDFTAQARIILKTADGLRQLCEVFLVFAFPLWIKLNRMRDVDLLEVQARKDRCEEEALVQNKLTNEFETYLEEEPDLQVAQPDLIPGQMPEDIMDLNPDPNPAEQG